MYSYSYMWLLPLLLPSACADEDVPSRPLHCPSEKNGVGVSVLVETELGLINGTRCGHLDHFLGVYYAEPPLGPLRFRPAVPKKKWAPTVMDATWYGCSRFSPSPTLSCIRDRCVRAAQVRPQLLHGRPAAQPELHCGLL